MNTIIENFVRNYKLRPADTIVVKKKDIGFLDHYLIYLGISNNEHKFIANYSNGVKFLEYRELLNYANDYSPVRIRRFNGNDYDRDIAVQRALSRLDQYSYNLIFNNCEHYANYVQYGSDSSNQTKIFGGSLAIAGIATAASSKNESTQKLGLLMTGLGFLTLLMDEMD
jgi:hypothetical protein